MLNDLGLYLEDTSTFFLSDTFVFETISLSNSLERQNYLSLGNTYVSDYSAYVNVDIRASICDAQEHLCPYILGIWMLVLSVYLKK